MAMKKVSFAEAAKYIHENDPKTIRAKNKYLRRVKKKGGK